MKTMACDEQKNSPVFNSQAFLFFETGPLFLTAVVYHSVEEILQDDELQDDELPD